jgi:hypothetical protein
VAAEAATVRAIVHPDRQQVVHVRVVLHARQQNLSSNKVLHAALVVAVTFNT